MKLTWKKLARTSFAAPVVGEAPVTLMTTAPDSVSVGAGGTFTPPWVPPTIDWPCAVCVLDPTAPTLNTSAESCQPTALPVDTPLSATTVAPNQSLTRLLLPLAASLP